MKIPIFKN